MSDIRKIATVIGDNKFAESYVIERLAKAGYVVRVAVPQPALVNIIRPFGNVGQIVPLYCSVNKENTVIRAIEGASVVVNMAEEAFGKNRNKLDNKNVKIAGNIARICAAAGVPNFIHFSALGADYKSVSKYLVSKKQGEDIVLQNYPDAVIMRPSVIFAPEDQFLNKLGQIASFFPVMPVYNVSTRLQPVYAGDIADAVMAVIGQPEHKGKIYELAGPIAYTNRELITFLVNFLHRRNDVSGLCPAAIRLMSFFLQFMPGSVINPTLLNLIQYDSVQTKSENGLTLLGITPMSVEMMAPVYLYCYRPNDDLTELKNLQQFID